MSGEESSTRTSRLKDVSALDVGMVLAWLVGLTYFVEVVLLG